jgi:hypothetical protein
MKKTVLFFSATTLVVLLFANFAIQPAGGNQDQIAKLTSFQPDVAKVLDKACYGCHNGQSRNEEAKEKLNLDTWTALNPMQKAGKTKAIFDVLEKGTMPPPRFLERFPDRKLTDDEVNVLKNWAKKELGQ